MSQRPVVREPKKIMVRSANWVGDAVMSIPALEALRKRFPEAEIVMVVKPWVSELYWYHPAINRQIVYDADGKHRGRHGFRELLKNLRGERFDMAILFQNAFHAAWMAWRAEIPRRIGFARGGRSGLLTDAVLPPPRAAYRHQAYDYIQLLFRAGLIAASDPVSSWEEPMLKLTDAERTWAERQLKALGLGGRRYLIGIHPGASFGPAKRWLPERFAALADRLVGALGADVLIFGSADEKPLAEQIAEAMRHSPLVVAGQTSLRQMMALFGQCCLAITNDSGPMHVAAGLGLPLVAIFGSTDERSTGPLSPRARVVKARVECSPCGLRVCPVDFRCMRGVTAEDAHRVALELLREAHVTP
ncbi:MAG: lipopolysaccharide heptosyltransferase II [Acidobacteria bacterium]|nr:MAG: lipopolysaccharide heptosyltransferase II [Acidobacteriota bacterium]